MAKALCSQCRGPRFDPWLGNWIPHAASKKIPHTTRKIPSAATNTQLSQINKYIKKEIYIVKSHYLSPCFIFKKKYSQEIIKICRALLGFPGGSDGKGSACTAGDLGSIPGSGRSPRGGHGNPLQYSCLENPMNRGAWRGYSPWGGKEWDTTE